MKVMTCDLAAARVVSGEIQGRNERSTLATSSLLVSAVLARVLERAATQKEKDGVTGAVFEMQGHRQTAGFHRSRGSGLATNKAGLELVKEAAAALHARVKSVDAPPLRRPNDAQLSTEGASRAPQLV